MRRILEVGLSCLWLLTGCAATHEQVTHSIQTDGLIKDNVIISNGTHRSYDMYVPHDLAGQAVPLVLLFHGHFGNSDVMTGENHKAAPYKVWLKLAEKYHFIVAIPNGMKGADGARGWNDCRAGAESNPTSDDVGFVTTLVSHLEQEYPIDTRRVYASGTSNGGYMVLRLAMEMSGTFAAVAPVVAAMPLHNECKAPTHPISVLFMNGTKDPFTHFNGGEIGKDKYKRGAALSTPASVNYWIKHDGTKSKPVIKQFPDLSSTDNSHVVRESYINGKQGTEVVLYKVIGGGHTEPSLEEKYGMVWRLIVGDQNHDIEMAREIWRFFKDKKQQATRTVDRKGIVNPMNKPH